VESFIFLYMFQGVGDLAPSPLSQDKLPEAHLAYPLIPGRTRPGRGCPLLELYCFIHRQRMHWKDSKVSKAKKKRKKEEKKQCLKTLKRAKKRSQCKHDMAITWASSILNVCPFPVVSNSWNFWNMGDISAESALGHRLSAGQDVIYCRREICDSARRVTVVKRHD